MKHVKILGPALLLLLAGLWLRGSAKTAVNAGTPSGSETSPSSLPAPAPDPAEARLTEARIQDLQSMDLRRLQMAAATASMTIYRERSQAEAAPRWRQVVTSNRDAYQALRIKAANSPRGETACTICDGKSYMPCVMCKDHVGKCITCRGSGHLNQEALCPACLGKGKCYLCTGSGRMFCPFCNDGTIEAHGRTPSEFPPLQ